MTLKRTRALASCRFVRLGMLAVSVSVVGLRPCSRASAQGYLPAEAVAQMQPAPGIEIALVAAEPDVRQPILVKCDDRGRLWTIQYLQYPNPAGLTRVAVDRWSRTVYDRVPEPPPRGPRGADRITICVDRDGDGRADEFRDFVAGLNLATGLEFGHGGVYVLQAPYLLFYPDRNRDDVPDGDPEALLEGFGMEDAQSLANHLTWGPDGWLYGVNGSTTTCRVRGHEFQQGVWRYHPRTRAFELWCEGGSNTYGLTFDDRGRLLYSTNGGPFVHGVGGGLFYKSFAKHGPLHHRFAYHYFPPLDCDQVPGGPPTGGTILESARWGEPWRGAFVAGNFLGHTVGAWRVEPHGGTVRARWLGPVIDSRDTWFGATDVCLGPSGELFVADFHDARTAHPDPDAQWDRSNGRIYRLAPAGFRPGPSCDLAGWGDDQLAGALESSEGWLRYRARAELARRENPALGRRLHDRALEEPDTTRALELLWGAHLLRGLGEAETLAQLAHADPWRRAWAVRLCADDREVSPAVAEALVEMVPTEDSLEVMTELAVAGRRLPPGVAWPLVAALLDREPASTDERVDWLTWWALESLAERERDAVVSRFAAPATWLHPGWRASRLRLIRRYAAEGTLEGYQACRKLLDDAPPGEEEHSIFTWLLAGLRERTAKLDEVGQGDLFAAQAPPRSQDESPLPASVPLSAELVAWIQHAWQAEPDQAVRLELALVALLPGAVQAMQNQLLRTDVDALSARAIWNTAGNNFNQLPGVDWAGILNTWLDAGTDDALAFVVDVVGRASDPAVAEALVTRWAGLPVAARYPASLALLGRRESATRLLAEVAAGRIPPADIPVDALRQVALLDDADLTAIVAQHWGTISPGTPEEKLAVMRRLSNDLRAGSGDPARGQALFRKHCATCHKLFGEGNSVGPDLTTANRNDRGALLANLVDPSAVVRREYLSWVVETASGQVLSGLLVAEDGASITLVDAQNRSHRLERSEVASLAESPVSLMPERLLEQLSPQELRDLFSYLER